MELLLPVIENALLATVPAVSFALLFNVPPRTLVYVAMGGAFARGLRTLLTEGGHVPLEWATLLAASLLSLTGVWLAHRLRAHPKVFTVAAVIPMIPGVPAYTTLLAIAQINRSGFTPQLWQTAMTNGLKALFLVGALAVGLAIPGLLFYRRKPVV
jgi:uncharacterized membrane protein YjjB (DUF3815 family)